MDKLSSGREWNTYSNGTDPCSHEHQSVDNSPPLLPPPSWSRYPTMLIWFCASVVSGKTQHNLHNHMIKRIVQGGVNTRARSRGNHLVRLLQFIVWEWQKEIVSTGGAKNVRSVVNIHQHISTVTKTLFTQNHLQQHPSDELHWIHVTYAICIRDLYVL